MTHRVFVSYNRADSSAFALGIADDLRSNGIEVWLDQRSIPVWVPWLAEIEAGIRSADLLLVIDSTGWRKSENCLVEAGLAAKWSVAIVYSAHASRVEGARRLVHQTLDQRGPDDRTRTELFARSGEWASNGSPRRALVRGTTLHRYQRIASAVPGGCPAEVHAFLGASLRRSRTITRLRRVGTLFAITVVLIGSSVYHGLEGAQKRIDTAISSFDRVSALDSAYEVGPYAYLDEAVQFGGTGWAVRAHLARALSVPLPDRVGRTSREVAAAFAASRESSGVMNPATNLRATVVVSPPRVVVADASTGIAISSTSTSAVPTSLAWSPDGDWVLARVGHFVELIDFAHGYSSQTMRGPVRDITAIAVTRNHVIAKVDSATSVWWPTPFVRGARPDRVWTNAIELPGTGSAILTSADGRLSIVDIASGSEIRSMKLDIPLGSSAGAYAVSPDGRSLFFSVVSESGKTSGRLVDVVTGVERSFDVGACIPLGATYDRVGGSITLECGQRGFAVIDMHTARTNTVPFDERVHSVTYVGHRLVAGVGVGVIAIIDPATMKELGRAETLCGQEIRPVVGNSRSGLLFHGGEAVGLSTCGMRVDINDPSRPAVNRLIVPWQHVDQARAVALRSDGTVALGFADDTVRTYTPQLDPITIRRATPGSIRGLVFSRDGHTLLVANADGQVCRSSSRRCGLGRRSASTSNRTIALGRSLGLFR